MSNIVDFKNGDSVIQKRKEKSYVLPGTYHWVVPNNAVDIRVTMVGGAGGSGGGTGGGTGGGSGTNGGTGGITSFGSIISVTGGGGGYKGGVSGTDGTGGPGGNVIGIPPMLKDVDLLVDYVYSMGKFGDNRNGGAGGSGGGGYQGGTGGTGGVVINYPVSILPMSNVAIVVGNIGVGGVGGTAGDGGTAGGAGADGINYAMLKITWLE